MDQVHCNLDSIHESWQWIAHSCSTRAYSNIIYSDADTQTQNTHTQIFGRLFLSCTVIYHSGRRRHRHDDNDDDVDDDDDDDDDDTEAADAPVCVVIVIMTLTLSHPPLHQHQESDSLLVGFAVKVWCMQQKYQPLHFLPSLQIKANKKFKFVTGNMRRLMEWGGTVTC